MSILGMKGLFLNHKKKEGGLNTRFNFTITFKKIMQAVVKLKDMLSVEYDYWAHSKTSSTFKTIQKCYYAILALTVAKNPLDLTILLWKINPEIKLIYHCFWAKKGDKMGNKRREACKLLEKVYAECLVLFRGQKFLNQLNSMKFSEQFILNQLNERHKHVIEICEFVKDEETKEENKD